MPADSGPDPHRDDLPGPDQVPWRGTSGRTRLAVAALIGVGAGSAVTASSGWRLGLLAGWIVAASVFVIWLWRSIWSMDAPTTASHAVAEYPGRSAADTTVVVAAVASLAAIALLLLGGSSGPGGKDVQAAVTVLSVALSWAAVHSIFTTRYARLYYAGADGGIDFNETDPPRYSDFAYLAFTIGMTFQVSDTDLQTKSIRATALRHALLSYLFGSIIIATTINLVAGLGG
ncbi:DUF1345 domain-containing protein [Pengzhenrongella sp.]|uniref:DUF1345 domain-containing protein n=1 Tax=Pengzhenrongella sp. TaxID=2888820 RepID=UPI002F947ABC